MSTDDKFELYIRCLRVVRDEKAIQYTGKKKEITLVFLRSRQTLFYFTLPVGKVRIDHKLHPNRNN